MRRLIFLASSLFILEVLLHDKLSYASESNYKERDYVQNELLNRDIESNFDILMQVDSNTLKICYISDMRCTALDCGYTLDGIRMINHSAPKLLNPVNFSSSGIASCSLELKPINVTITEEVIDTAGCDIFFVGSFASADTNCNSVGTSGIPSTELQAIRSWSTKSSDNLAIVSQGEAIEWGYTPTSGNVNPNFPTLSGTASKIFDGPFGQVSAFTQGGCYQGGFSARPSKTAHRPCPLFGPPCRAQNPAILGIPM